MSETFHLFEALVDFASQRGAKDLKNLDGCWEQRWQHAGNEWFVAIHGNSSPRKCSTGAEIPALTFWVECNGWPAGIVDMFGWALAAGSVINEDAFRAALAVPVA